MWRGGFQDEIATSEPNAEKVGPRCPPVTEVQQSPWAGIAFGASIGVMALAVVFTLWSLVSTISRIGSAQALSQAWLVGVAVVAAVACLALIRKRNSASFVLAIVSLASVWVALAIGQATSADLVALYIAGASFVGANTLVNRARTYNNVP